MDVSVVATIIASVVGGSGLFTFLGILITKKQIQANADKTGADAASVLSTASIALLDPYQKQLTILGNQLTRTQTRAEKVEERLISANNDLRSTKDLLRECNVSIALMQKQLKYYYDRYGPPPDDRMST